MSDQRREAHRLRQTPFYQFMKENRDIVISINPSMNELEVMAFLQAKWDSMTDE